jgi:hypothetical protein
MRVSSLLRIALAVEIVALLIVAVSLARDYQDAWPLEGLEIPFLIFIATFLAYFFVEKRLSWILIVVIVVRLVLVAIPNLKYVWFQGTEYDVNIHYRLYQDIYVKGFTPSGSVYNNMQYLDTPLMQIWFAIGAIVTGIPSIDAFKYLPVLTWLLYPLLIYVIMKRSLPENHESLKYALLVSSIPVRPNLSYLVEGQLVGALLVTILVIWLIRLFQSSQRSMLIVLWICSFALVAQHSYSPIILIIGLLTVYILSKIKYVKNRYGTFTTFKFSYVIFLAVLTASWLTFVAETWLHVGANILRRWSYAILGTTFSGRSFTDINLSLFKLTLENQLRIIIVFYGGSLLFAFLTAIGILITFRKYKSSKSLMFLSLFLISIWLFFIFQFALPAGKAGILEYHRMFSYTLPFAPVFIGLLLSHLNRKFVLANLIPILISFLVVFAIIELYGYQPLLPIASSVRPNLPSDEYIIYVDKVNSVYQRSMIEFAERHIDRGMIACDPITQNQILGLTDYNFSQTHLADFYPFDSNAAGEEFDYFLIHFPGKSGWPGVKPELGTKDFILGVTYNSTLTYSNGESFVLTGPFMYNVNP